MKKFISVILGLLCFIGKIQANENILFLTDIHFNPYTLCREQPCQVLTRLIENDTKYWPQILADDNIIDYKIETGNGFLITGFKNLMPIMQQNNVHNIFLTGDILAHNFYKQYFKYVDKRYNNQKSFTNFSLKTSIYVLKQAKLMVNNGNVFYVLGNNDGDRADYISPSASFLSNMAKLLSEQLNSEEKILFEKDFSTAGYFNLPLNKKTIIIGINSNLLSNMHPEIKLATLQLKWLKATLAKALEHNQQVIMLQHIPYGADFFKSTLAKSSVMLIDRI